MTVAFPGSPPEQGQLVSVRSRNWIVTEVAPSTLPPERLRTGLESPQHLLTLSSVEDDGLGEELNVIWELEPGARLVEKVALPDPTGFDPPAQLDAFWGASSSAYVRNIQAPFRSGIDIEDYQLDPVLPFSPGHIRAERKGVDSALVSFQLLVALLRRLWLRGNNFQDAAVGLQRAKARRSD